MSRDCFWNGWDHEGSQPGFASPSVPLALRIEHVVGPRSSPPSPSPIPQTHYPKTPSITSRTWLVDRLHICRDRPDGRMGTSLCRCQRNKLRSSSTFCQPFVSCTVQCVIRIISILIWQPEIATQRRRRGGGCGKASAKNDENRTDLQANERREHGVREIWDSQIFVIIFGKRNRRSR